MNELRFLGKMAITVVSLFLLGFVSCKSIKQNKLPKEFLVFPPPPDTARIQYLTSLSTSLDLGKSEGSAFVRFVTGEKTEVKGVVKPFGICMKFGKIYVSDIGAKRIDIFDLQNKKIEYLKPTGKAQFMVPSNCFADINGNLYVTDAGRKQVLVFDNELNFINSFGPTENFLPTAIVVNNDKIYVANFLGHRIDIFKNDSTYQFIKSFPDVEKDDDSFLHQPKNITFRNGKVYVSDFGEFNIKVFDENGEYLSSIGSVGTMPGQFSRPKGVAVDKEDNLYVVDAAFGNAQIFNKDEKLLMFFGGPYNGKGYMYLPAGIYIDYENTKYFQKYVDPAYELKYIILVTNQYTQEKVNVYGRIVHNK